MHEKVFRRLLFRPDNSHKYSFGHVLVIGGSPGMVGAPLLAGRAAMRAGAGLVTIASTPEVIDKLEMRVAEIMTHSFASNESEAIQSITDFVKDRKVSVLAIGPGIAPGQTKLAQRLIETINLPIVIDGGALTAIQTQPEILNKLSGRILTPHRGEFQRFFHKTLPDNSDELKTVAQEFATKYGITLVLKGNPTYVLDAKNEIYINTTGGPGLATAGSGDTLTGIIAGFIAQGIEPFAAASAAVYIHGLAGDIATTSKTEPGVIATDIIAAIPQALKTNL